MTTAKAGSPGALVRAGATQDGENAAGAVRAPGVESRAGDHRIESVEDLLSADGIYDIPPEQAEELRVRLIGAAVAWHIDRNRRFAAFCDRLGFEAGQLRDGEDLSRVPLLPSSLFKRGADVISTTPADSDVLMTTSSGTQGSVSVVPRDDLTLTRFFSTVGVGIRELLSLETSNVQLFNLGPRNAEHLWIAYVMTGVALFLQGRSYTVEGRFLLDDLLDDLCSMPPWKRAGIVGPPSLMLDLATALEARGRIRLAPSSIFVTIGGWKLAGGSALPRAEFDARIARAFGVEDEGQVRDAFNMVELNSVVFECAAKRKHCPPWLFAQARDPRTLQPLDSGGVGILAYLDPTPTSYPGFLLSDDFGSVLRSHRCACGRTGDVLTLERRVNRVESRGCALKLDMTTGGRP